MGVLWIGVGAQSNFCQPLPCSWGFRRLGELESHGLSPHVTRCITSGKPHHFSGPQFIYKMGMVQPLHWAAEGFYEEDDTVKHRLKIGRHYE